MSGFVEKRYAAHAQVPGYVLDPSMGPRDSGTLLSICKRPEIQPLLQNISFQVSKDLQIPFKIDPVGTIVLSREILDNSSLSAFHVRHALELVAWHRLSSGPSDLLATFLMAITGWHTAVSYFDTMIIHEKHLAFPQFPDWMKAARAEVHRRYAEECSSLEVAKAIGQYWKFLVPLQGCDPLAIGQIPHHHMVLEQAWTLASKTLLLATPCEHILSTNGDTRLLVDQHTGLNAYGCSPKPRPWAYTFSSCTASSISEIGYNETERCRQSFFEMALGNGFEKAFSNEREKARSELATLLGLHHIPGTEIIFTSSGTDGDFHALCFALGLHGKPVVNILISPEEIGSGTIHAAGGSHFQCRTPSGRRVEPGTPLEGFPLEQISIQKIPIRNKSGKPIPSQTIEKQLADLVSSTCQAGKIALVHILDSSKTGLSAPSLEAVVRLKDQYGSSVMVLVDAAQLRLGQGALKGYLDQGWMVLITGSKFFTAPPFAGALLIPSGIARQVDQMLSLPIGMGDYATRFDLPPRWAHLASNLSGQPNLGLLLRWRAALWEMQAFHAVPMKARFETLQKFQNAILQAIQDNPDLELLPGGSCVRGAHNDAWENLQTIFTFLVKKNRVSGERITPLTYEEGQLAYRWLNMDIGQFLPIHASEEERRLAQKRCHIGQPVRIVRGKEKDIVGLRLAAGARLVTGVHFDQSLGNTPEERLSTKIRTAKFVLEKLSIILQYWEQLSHSDIESGVTQGLDHYLF